MKSIEAIERIATLAELNEAIHGMKVVEVAQSEADGFRIFLTGEMGAGDELAELSFGVLLHEDGTWSQTIEFKDWTAAAREILQRQGQGGK